MKFSACLRAIYEKPFKNNKTVILIQKRSFAQKERLIYLHDQPGKKPAKGRLMTKEEHDLDYGPNEDK